MTHTPEQLALALRKLEQGEDATAVLSELSERLTNKLIHAPTEALRQTGEAEDKKLVIIIESGLTTRRKN